MFPEGFVISPLLRMMTVIVSSFSMIISGSLGQIVFVVLVGYYLYVFVHDYEETMTNLRNLSVKE